MAYQLSDLVSQVQSKLRDTNYPPNDITKFINETQRELFNRHLSPFTEESETYTLEVGDTDITQGSGLPDNFQTPISLRITTEDRERLLTPVSYKWIDEFRPESGTDNLPKYWFRFGDTIFVHPPPDEAYTVLLRYYKTPSEMSADADIPDLPPEFQELLVVGATYRALETKDNYDQAGVLKYKFNELLEDMTVRFSVGQFGKPHRMRINRRPHGKNSVF